MQIVQALKKRQSAQRKLSICATCAICATCKTCELFYAMPTSGRLSLKFATKQSTMSHSLKGGCSLAKYDIKKIAFNFLITNQKEFFSKIV